MQRPGDRLEAAFAREEVRVQNTAAPVLLVIIALITAWITWENGFPAVLFLYPFMLGFAAISAAGPLLRRLGWQPWWERYARFAIGVVMLAVMLLTPNPLGDAPETAAMRLRWQNEVYFFVLIAAAVFTYSPRVVLATGLAAALVWLGSSLWIAQLAGNTSEISPETWATLTLEQRRLAMMDPHFVFVHGVVRGALVMIAVAVMLAAFVRRSRSIVGRHADAERQRDNLSRYFSANVVDELAQQDEPLSVTRLQNAAVLFADIVGFTTMGATESPETVIETLRQFHRRTQHAIFAHGGTLEKFIGDEVMATFGTPRPGADDATRSLRCARDLAASIEEWNTGRRIRALPPLAIGVGIHYGPVVLGDIGGEQRLEFAVVGDAVNVAHRLERLTRELGCLLVVSGDLIDAAEREGGQPDEILPGLRQIEAQPLRGRAQPMRLWIWNAVAAARPRVP